LISLRKALLPPHVVNAGRLERENKKEVFMNNVVRDPPTRPGLKTLYIALAAVGLFVGIKYWTEISAFLGL
jgi:hypothetical protein